MLNLAFLANTRTRKFPIITAITYCPQERELVTGCNNGEIYVWNSDQSEFTQNDIKLRIIPTVIQNLSHVSNLRIIDKSVLHYMVNQLIYLE